MSTMVYSDIFSLSDHSDHLASVCVRLNHVGGIDQLQRSYTDDHADAVDSGLGRRVVLVLPI